MTRFDAPWDASLRATTAVGVVLVLGVTAVPVALALGEGLPAGAMVFAIIGPVLATLFLPVAWAFAPADFVLEGNRLLVRRNGLGPVEIPLTSVRTVGELPPGGLRGAWRTLGTSGFFGHFGRFRSRALGDFRMYATRSQGLVAVRTADALFVLSPEPPRAFVEAVLARAPAAREAAPGEAGGATPGRPAFRAAWVVALAIGVPALAVGATLAVAWARAPRSIGVEGGAVVVERNRWGPERIPLAQVRGVEPLAPERLRGLRRVSGYAAGGVRYGTFRAPALGTFELYATGRGGCVLLETAEGKVVVTPDDPAAFVRAARGEPRPAP
jgi:hypothetical protein